MATRPPQSFVSVLLSLLLLSGAEASHTPRSYFDSFRSFTHRATSLSSRASIVLPTDWYSHGCVREPSSGRTLTGYSFTSDSLTITSCVAECNSRGFKYAGAEYGSECYCGNSFEGGDTGGGTITSSECTMNCSDCGAGYRLSSYEKRSNVTVAPEPTSGRTLTGYSFTDPGMTIDKCVATCNSKGFHIAGAEYSDECYCGDAFQATSSGGGTSAPNDCTMACAGESTQQCGSGGRLSIYSIPQTTTPPPTPANVTLPTGWAYVGCTKEPSTGRLLTAYSFTSSSLTVETCISTCQSRGWIYAGVEYGNECYCGNGYATTAVSANEKDCSMPCAGKSSEICGAGYRLSVYSSDPSPGTTSLILPAYWSKTPQCITEASTGRALSGNSQIDGGMTVEKCVSLCDSTGFSFAGLQYKNECYCDNSISTANGGGVAANANDCSMPCAGNSAEICGAGYRISLYTKTAPAAAALPAGWSPSMCAVDNAARVLTGYKGADKALTPTSCITKCASLNFTLSGVENGNECYCGNILTNNPVGARDVQCNVPCSGDASQNCGGSYRMMIYQKMPDTASGPTAWTLSSGGTSGVVMTHVAVVNSETILVIDRKENNPLLNAHNLPAWGAVWSLVDNTARALNIETHSFCSAGSFLSNGTMVNFGGQPYTNRNGEAAPDGQQGVRLFNACPASGTCDIYENSSRIRLGSNRWYPTSARLPDGSAIIIGGSMYSGWTNSDASNNPTYEFYPAKNINGYNGLPVPSQFFNDTLPHNTVGIRFRISCSSLPDERLFVAANNQAMLLNWHTNTETRLPNFPNGQRVVYPLNAAGILLPLTPENNYTPEVLICGGSQISDKTAPENLDAQHDYGSAQCSRMVLNDAGISAGWKTEWMPEPRLMSEGTLLPDGKVLIINGGRTGTAGYDNLQSRRGSSNADHPTFTPLLYDPSAPVGSRFSRAGLATSNIPRLYHSVATMLPSGAIMIGGSNPNDDMSTKPYASEYRVEYLYPPYMQKTRPTFTGLPAKVAYNATFTLAVTVPSGAKQKLVKLVSVRQGAQLIVTGPPSAPVYSPGPGWIMVMADGVPSVAQQVMIGSGANPPEDDAAIANMLASTKNPSSGPD
ncbi:glyoxal oxidase N-terminus-domain-containing protein [Mycena latifolia]|nr:glyoxal oxidase N-terminus-domain-containing protein [Mycena latifolia]